MEYQLQLLTRKCTATAVTRKEDSKHFEFDVCLQLRTIGDSLLIYNTQIHTPQRKYHLRAHNAKELTYWVEGISKVIIELRSTSNNTQKQAGLIERNSKLLAQLSLVEACENGNAEQVKKILADKEIDLNYWVEGQVC